jgi:elongation factor Ts
VVVEVNSETDFVARNDDFVKLTLGLAQHIASHAPADVAALLEQPWAPGKTVKDAITEKVATIGEHLAVRRFVRLQVEGEGALGLYLHTDHKKASLVEVKGAASAEAKELARELAMQLAALRPPYVDRKEVPAEVIEKEKEIYREEIRRQPKQPPEAMWEKILTGKLEKYFENNCLVDQVWIKDDKKKIKDVIAEHGKRAGKPLSIGRTARIEVGEGVEKKKDDLAAEVAKTLGQG